MPKVALYDMQGSQVGDIDLNEEVFGIKPNESVVHEAVVMQLASLRQGTSSTKSRGEVRGGGRKPWRQKGTGRARVGTIRSPLWRGGAITFGPKPRDYSYTIPKKKRRLALKSVLSAKVQDGEIIVLEDLQFAQPKTKEMVALLKNFDASKALVITLNEDENVIKSARNIPGVTSLSATGLNVYDVIYHDKLIITKDAVAKVEEVLA